ncbi:M20/M25/M40 family metallo-hydrolase [Haloferax mediterranei ATCC 33500]|uniref:M20/M25/M40 family metallo-hydrolase n=1 Tax=Haloferax mediterranei (strain ATCC 33500 / DSM 1411 / JCM 8866 / NBRC 14739 / NCIMB 2177 / R-4) TaxID=523841 RepID=I3R3L0_HALMT|nr:M20 family metallopeptidase [Haloferax mediterranei]AFK18820.1 succinyl-diaminopimelate desuccinylase [Haloferax mediterranei ATCC 33500]AHZ21813.1 succinyl-diaminopimelate desuccinylase [Haloferax mediterranei ATCC 33500]EMA03322.1 succinyl-diaminopimelate desuccinylase [Haloferax mediterranei ATCC 33500]MDX5988913.1 M20 family metallopeptidase [Haloferax mediterranei ATCC 33500]QCQ75311.1 M20/M25/M40 family metallo-hydrolase [Haloferax mediterranei ATCC 33500]
MNDEGFDPIAFLERAVPVASNDDVDEMRDLLVETLESHGTDATVDDAGNTLAAKGVSDPETHLVLNTHIDTVSPHIPYAREEGIIHGRGSCDAKGPLAALLAAFFAVDPAPDARVTLAITPDEELLSTGAAALDVDGDCYIVGEPTGLDVCTAAKGRFEGTVTLAGIAAHAAEPDSGSNAIDALAPVLDAIRSFDDDRDEHPDLGAATLTPTMVNGGENSNQVPAACRLVVDRRSVPPETAGGFREALESTLRDAAPDEVGVDFELTERPTPFLEAFATDPDYELVTTLARASREAGGRGAVRPFTAATEASYFSPSPVVVFGPGELADDEGAVAHADREYVTIDDVRTAATSLKTAVSELIGTATVD